MDTIKSITNSSTDSLSCTNCWAGNFQKNKNCLPDLPGNFLLKKEEKKYKKGAYLLKNGEAVSGIFCIQKGNVKIFKKGIRKNDFIMWVAGKGDVVGLNSFVNDEFYSFSAAAINDVNVCFIPEHDLKILLNKEPAFFLQLMSNLCEKINFVEHRIISISKKSIKEQCAELIISIAAPDSLESDKKVIINYSIKDLASFVGTTKNYLYKILDDFSSKEILSVTNRKLVIKNMKALSLIASGNDK